MRVESIVTSESKLRYLLVNDVGDPVEPVLKYLKYKDNTGVVILKNRLENCKTVWNY